MAEKKWTQKMVAIRLEEAVETMKRLPNERMQGYRSSWPETLPSWGDYRDSKTKVRLGPPSPDAIDRMDETLAWLRWLEPAETKLAWAVASRINRKVIGSMLGVHRTTIWREWSAIMRKLAAIINMRQAA